MIKLVRESIPSEPVTPRHTWPITIRATTQMTDLVTGELGPPGTDEPAHIFVYHKNANEFNGPEDPYFGDLFYSVVSNHELPLITPVSTDEEINDLQEPFYRTDVLFLHCSSHREAEDLWSLVTLDVQNLLDNIQANNSLVENEEIVLTARPMFVLS